MSESVDELEVLGALFHKPSDILVSNLDFWFSSIERTNKPLEGDNQLTNLASAHPVLRLEDFAQLLATIN